MKLNTVSLSRINLPCVSLAIGNAGAKRDGNVNFIEIADEEVQRILIAHGMSKSPLGLTTEDTEKITSFEDWFVGNKDIRYVEIGQFPMLESCNLEGTYASVDFEKKQTEEGDAVSMAEIDEYLNNLGL